MASKKISTCGIFLITSGTALVLASGGCKKQAASETAPSPTPATRTPVQIEANACGLLKYEEIQQVQESAIKETKGSGNSDGRVRVLQCYFSAEQSNRSVSLMVTQSDPASADKTAAKQAWEQTFGRYRDSEQESDADKEKKESLREQKSGREEEEHKIPPKKIDGIGEEAFWIGNRVGGALYVVKKDAFIRLSLGGPDTEEDKIKKTKALAEKALGRL